MHKVVALMEVFLHNKHGETFCGDRFLSIPQPLSTLYVMVDGVGHGKEASFAADKACVSILSAAEKPLHEIVTCCEASLTETRGVAISFVRQTPSKNLIEYVGIGNVESYIFSDRRTIQLAKKPGIFGNRRRSFEIKSQAIPENATLLMFTDGVGQVPVQLMHHFQNMRPRHMVKVLSERWKGKDDICILCEDLSNDWD
jgi:hypothetical protein